MPCGRIDGRERSWDVAVVGGGPAGCAAALTLRERYPALRVGVIEASQYGRPRPGEVLSPAAIPMLEQLGVAASCRTEASRPVHATAVCWGAPVLTESAHLFTAHGPGWHLDRARFDAVLAGAAENRGALVEREFRVAAVERSGGSWRLRGTAGEVARAPFVIDASGRGAAVARAAGARLRSADHLTGFVAYFLTDEDDCRTVIESVEYGWWYTAGLEGGFRVVACMTDADIGRELGLANGRLWSERMRATRYVARSLPEGLAPAAEPLVRPAGTQHAEPVCGSDWLAAGDAALALDPLCGHGIASALRSGIFAAYAAGDWLAGRRVEGLARYEWFIDCARSGYLRAYARYYGDEGRWPDCVFWQRRRPS